MHALHCHHILRDGLTIKVFLPLIGHHAACCSQCRFNQSHNVLLFNMIVESAFLFPSINFSPALGAKPHVIRKHRSAVGTDRMLIGIPAQQGSPRQLRSACRANAGVSDDEGPAMGADSALLHDPRTEAQLCQLLKSGFSRLLGLHLPLLRNRAIFRRPDRFCRETGSGCRRIYRTWVPPQRVHSSHIPAHPD